MDEAEAIRIANRVHAKKRWMKAGRKERYEAGRRMTDARKQNCAILPRMQDTRTAQALELHAEDFDAFGQKEKAAQISMVLLKHTKEIYLAKAPGAACQPSAEQIAAWKAEVAAMTDEELRAGLKEVRP